VAFLIILITYAGLSGTLFRLAHIPLDSDEATHALDGLQIATDVSHGEVESFFEHFYFTSWYPPLFPTYLGLFFLSTQPAAWSARYAVLMLAVLYLALMYRVSGLLAANRVSGLVTLVLAATSPLIWTHSLLCMEEMLALIGVLLTILATIRAHKGQWHPSWVGTFMAGTLLTRTSIGIALAGAILLTLALDGLKRGRVRLAYAGRMLAPLIVVGLLWWGHPHKLEDLAQYIQASPPAYESLGWQEAGYYWRAVLTSSTVSPLAGAVVLLSIVSAALSWRKTASSLPLALILTTWIVLLLKKQLNTRFFIAALSAVFLLTGHTITKLSSSLLTRKGNGRKGAYALLALVLVVGTIPFLIARAWSFPFLMEVAYETDPEAHTLFAWIESETDRNAPIFLVNGWDQVSISGLNFYLGRTDWPDWQAPQATDVFLIDPEREPQHVDRFYSSLDAHARSYVVHLSNTPVPNAGAWWAYRPAVEACWDGDWQSVTSYWIHLWDIGLEAEILSHPFRYVNEAERLVARERYRYPLQIEAKVTICRPVLD
jgi:4-amino-4-deoxy-L-arabinose transferase-like glycosyltransferase